MKIDEIIFFIYCYTLRTYYDFTIRDVVDIFTEHMSRKRCWYLLKKWANKGFYNYGITLDLGWFEPQYMPERYTKILEVFSKKGE